MKRKTKSLLALLLCITLSLGLSMNVAATGERAEDNQATEETQTTEDIQLTEDTPSTEDIQVAEDISNVQSTDDSSSVSAEDIEELKTELTTLQQDDAIIDNQLIVVAKDEDALQETITESPEDTLIEVVNTNEETFTTVETTEDLATKMAEFEADPNVESVQPNFKYTLQDNDVSILADTNDTLADRQWYLSGKVLVKDTWDYSKTQKKIKVAVIDSGIDASHEDLKANISSNSYDFVKNTATMTDSNGHGTHVAGIIAAVADNSIGMAGVSYNAELLSYRVTWEQDKVQTTDSATMLKAYNRAVNDGAKVINMSIGGYQTDVNMDVLLVSAITEAESKGIVTVCAGGNGATSQRIYPADYEACISVVATNSNNARVSFSDYNEYKDIAAPGEQIASTWTNNQYAYDSGTSMASPVVAGVASLMFAADSSLSVEQLKDYLYTTATDLGTAGWDKYYGNGLVNAKAAVQKVLDDDDTYTKSTKVNYETHVQTYGWQDSVRDGQISGTTGLSKRLEGIKISLSDQSVTGSIQYKTHIQTIGWQAWKENGALSGTTAQSKRLEAIRIRLTGEMANKYDIYYRVHAQHYGWLNWAKNGDAAGTAGCSYRLEAIQIQLVEKGSSAPGSTTTSYIPKSLVSYQTHIQTIGWQGLKYDGVSSGTVGQSKRLEGIKINLVSPAYDGNIQYKTHVQTYGWENSWTSGGGTSGTTGQSKRLEAIQIKLTDEMAEKYDIYYRVHSQQFGWMDWAKNGDSAGTSGYSYRLEAIQIKLVSKGGAAPGSTTTPYRSK